MRDQDVHMLTKQLRLFSYHRQQKNKAVQRGRKGRYNVRQGVGVLIKFKVTKGCKHTHNTAKVFSLCCRTHTTLWVPCKDIMSYGTDKAGVLLCSMCHTVSVVEVQITHSMGHKGFHIQDLQEKWEVHTLVQSSVQLKLKILPNQVRKLFNLTVLWKPRVTNRREHPVFSFVMMHLLHMPMCV